jgi:hypothetical protein
MNLLQDLNIRNWADQHQKDCAFIYRRMEQKDLYWTPIGLLTHGQIFFMTSNGMLAPTDDKRFYAWVSFASSRKWQRIKSEAHKSLVRPKLAMIQAKLISLRDADYVQMSITGAFTYNPDDYKSLGRWLTLSSNQESTPEELEMHVVFTKYTEICEDIEQDSEGIFEKTLFNS